MSKRQKHKASGYSEAGGSLDRRALRSFKPNSHSPEEDISSNNRTLRERSRMLYMAAPVAAGAINTNRTKVVGVGLELKCAVNRTVLGISSSAAKKWQTTTEQEWKLWAGKKKNCDAIGVNNFNSLQQLAMKAWLMSGDCFALIKRYEPTALNPYSLRIHLVEADRVRTPTNYHGGFGSYYIAGSITDGVVPEGKEGAGNAVHDGVEVDKSGNVVAYYISNRYPNQIAKGDEVWTRVLAYGTRTGTPNILQVMESERPDQYRGVPYLAQVIEPLLQLRRYTESELMAALVQSFFTAWITSEADKTSIPFNEAEAPIRGSEISGTEQGSVGYSENEYRMGPGTSIHLDPGENVHFGNPNIPTSGFDNFCKAICKQVGAALEIPYDVLMKEFNASYSASRGALLEAWEAFKMRRAWFVDDFCQPIYELWLAEAVARGRIQAPGFFDDPLIRAAWCGTRWIGPVQGSLEPLKEAKANLLLIDRGIKTHDQVTREMTGGNWESNVGELEMETKALNKAKWREKQQEQVNMTDTDNNEGEATNAE